ncbi:MAG: tRNA pseudouridine(55) synthase TruB [Carbonactinosporaceae bacterium]
MNDGPRSGGPGGLVVVDKPGGWTSHDVVARVRSLAGTRRVGHAGTLDPMATGVLVLGVGRATRLLGHLTLTEKAYTATVRLGEATLTDDAEGEVIATAPAAGVSDGRITAAVAALTGEIRQVPSKVSAVKIQGRRSYQRVRAGEDVELAARPVTVRAFEVGDIRRAGDRTEVDVSVVCSSGTYVRALARDLGAALGVGGHLTRLRRTRVGPFSLPQARTLGQLEATFDVLPLEEAAAAAFPRRDVGEHEAKAVTHGGRLPAAGLGPGPVGVFGPDGRFLALVEEAGGQARSLAVFAG